MNLTDEYVAVHKEFNDEHDIIVTIFGGKEGKGTSYDECLDWCKKVNRKGFHYKPYKRSEIIVDPKYA